MTTFTLNSRFLDADQNVWLVYSGRARQFFDTFAANNCVFLTVPGFDAAANTFEDPGRIRQHLRMADEVRRWINGQRQDPPPRRAAQYRADPEPANTPEGRRFNAELGNLERLFRRVRKGDLILSPARGHYLPMLIGEVVSEWQPEQVLPVERLDLETVPYREVRWIRDDIARRDFPPRVARAIENQHAISLLDEEYYEEIYKIAYDAYVWRGRSKMDFAAPLYSGHDPLETYEGAFLIKYFVAAFEASENGNIEEFGRLSPKEAVVRFYSRERVTDFIQEFSSPGKFTLLGVGTTLASVVGICVAITVSSDNLDALMHEFDIVPGLIQREAVDEIDIIREKVKHLIDGVGRSRIAEVKDEFGEIAREQLGLSPAAEE